MLANRSRWEWGEINPERVTAQNLSWLRSRGERCRCGISQLLKRDPRSKRDDNSISYFSCCRPHCHLFLRLKRGFLSFCPCPQRLRLSQAFLMTLILLFRCFQLRRALCMSFCMSYQERGLLLLKWLSCEIPDQLPPWKVSVFVFFVCFSLLVHVHVIFLYSPNRFNCFPFFSS